MSTRLTWNSSKTLQTIAGYRSQERATTVLHPPTTAKSRKRKACTSTRNTALQCNCVIALAISLPLKGYWLIFQFNWYLIVAYGTFFCRRTKFLMSMYQYKFQHTFCGSRSGRKVSGCRIVLTLSSADPLALVCCVVVPMLDKRSMDSRESGRWSR